MATLSRKEKHGKVTPYMNVTPLVDVVLVLLIIFMVVLPAMNSDLNLELANINNPDAEKKGEPDPFVLSIDREGLYFLDNKMVRLEDLGAHLSNAHTAQPEKKLVLRGDRRMTYAKARELLGVIQGVGFPGISLRVQKTVGDEVSLSQKSQMGAGS